MSPGALAGSLLARALPVACCALGPVVVLAGIAGALARPRHGSLGAGGGGLRPRLPGPDPGAGEAARDQSLEGAVLRV
jgi:hypothetical protein